MSTFTANICLPCACIIESATPNEHDLTPAQFQRVSAFLETVPFYTVIGYGVEDGRGRWQTCDCCQETVLDTVPIAALP